MTSTVPSWKIDNQSERLDALKKIHADRMAVDAENKAICEAHRRGCKGAKHHTPGKSKV